MSDTNFREILNESLKGFNKALDENIKVDIQKLLKDARNYYSKMKISPTQEEIEEYIAQALSDQADVPFEVALNKVKDVIAAEAFNEAKKELTQEERLKLGEFEELYKKAIIDQDKGNLSFSEFAETVRALKKKYGITESQVELVESKIMEAEEDSPATEILRQLGGAGRLRVMIGATNFFSDNNGSTLHFKCMYGWTIKITLNGMDTYDIKFFKYNKLKKEINGVYEDQLMSILEQETDLRFSLGSMGEGKDTKYVKCEECGYHWAYNVSPKFCPECQSEEFIDYKLPESKVNEDFTKVAVINTDGKLTLRCPKCKEINPTTRENYLEKHEDVICKCGQKFSYNGWLKEAINEEEDNGEKNYKIVRYFKSGRKKTLHGPVTLEVAKLHCNDPRTKGKNYFDGFAKYTNESTINEYMGRNSNLAGAYLAGTISAMVSDFDKQLSFWGKDKYLAKLKADLTAAYSKYSIDSKKPDTAESKIKGYKVEVSLEGLIKDLDTKGLDLVANSQDVKAIKQHFYNVKELEKFDGFFVKVDNADYSEVYGFEGSIPYTGKNVYSIKLHILGESKVNELEKFNLNEDRIVEDRKKPTVPTSFLKSILKIF